MVSAPKRITILGSTGSVGVNTLDLVSRNRETFDVVALTASRNADRLAEQVRVFKPSFAAIADPDAYADLKDAVSGIDVEIAAGPHALVEAAQRSADVIMAAIVGAAGLEPTLAAVSQGTVVALANKECLVCAGSIFMDAVHRHKTTLLPVDSEHSAIFQVLDRNQSTMVERIILTASGGPFRTWTKERMAKATPAEAVAHPNWSMGDKISVDSATMMNKGLELIEAHHLFGLGEEQIEILVHPQSVVHSLVDYADGSVLAQLGTPDMRTPIAYALSWPDRMRAPSDRLELAEIASLTFEAPDIKRFPALRLARTALQSGAGTPTLLNAANEVAVTRFMAGDIGFLDIVAAVEETLSRCQGPAPATLEDVQALDAEARGVTAAWPKVGFAAE